MKYVGLFKLENQVFWIVDIDTNQPRLFEDMTLAQQTALAFSPIVKVVTEQEFEEMLKVRDDTQSNDGSREH